VVSLLRSFSIIGFGGFILAIALRFLPFNSPFLPWQSFDSRDVPPIAPVQIATAGNRVQSVEILGQVAFPTGFAYQNTEVGGLSGITYDPTKEVYYTVSDDRSQRNPARFYKLKIDVSQGRLTSEGVKFVGVTTLFDTDRQPFPSDSLDLEGIAVTPAQRIWVSSEGNAEELIAPFIRQFSFAGQSSGALSIPQHYLPTADRSLGIPNNSAFESLTVTPEGQFLIAATEDALYQDDPNSDPAAASPCRILRYTLSTQKLDGEFLYWTEAVSLSSERSTTRIMGGLADLAALDREGNFLGLERSYIGGVGLTMRLYEVSLSGASNIRGLTSLVGRDVDSIEPVKKTLLLDLNSAEIDLDNFEGMAVGPILPDGRQVVVLVSDNNFSPFQATRFLVLALRLANEPPLQG
jgi:hypothetical protein